MRLTEAIEVNWEFFENKNSSPKIRQLPSNLIQQLRIDLCSASLRIWKWLSKFIIINCTYLSHYFFSPAAFNMSALENSLDHIPTSMSSNGLTLSNNVVNQMNALSSSVPNVSVANVTTPNVSLQQPLPTSSGEPIGIPPSPQQQPSSIVVTSKPNEVVMNGPVSPSMKQVSYSWNCNLHKWIAGMDYPHHKKNDHAIGALNIASCIIYWWKGHIYNRYPDFHVCSN